VAIRAQNTIAVIVIQQHKFTGKLVVIWCDLLTVQAQIWVPICAFDIPENVIVGPVFLDDVNDVLECGVLKVSLLRRCWP